MADGEDGGGAGEGFAWGDAAPLGGAEAAGAGVGQGQALADAQAGGGLQGVRQCVQQGGVAVGGFDEELGLAGFQGQGFEGADALGAGGGVLRQVADEGEVLPVQAA